MLPSHTCKCKQIIYSPCTHIVSHIQQSGIYVVKCIKNCLNLGVYIYRIHNTFLWTVMRKI